MIGEKARPACAIYDSSGEAADGSGEADAEKRLQAVDDDEAPGIGFPSSRSDHSQSKPRRPYRHLEEVKSRLSEEKEALLETGKSIVDIHLKVVIFKSDQRISR